MDLNAEQAATPALVNGLTGIPAYEPTPASVLHRAGGTNRYATAVAISKSTWSDSWQNEGLNTAHAAVLTRGDSFADALSAGALAAAKYGPLLMTPPSSLDPGTASELTRILGTGGLVYIVGGTGAVSSAVESKLKALGFKTKRLAGADRYATSVAIANEINPDPTAVFVTTGRNFPDALSAGSAAGAINYTGKASAVVVLSADTSLPAATKSYIDNLNAGPNPPTLFGVGGPGYAALQSAHYTNGYGIVGSDRYYTAIEVASFFFPNGAPAFGLATGANWPDALAGSADMGFHGGPLLLTPSTNVTSSVSDYLDSYCEVYGFEFVYGQTGVVTDQVANSYAADIAGPGGTDVTQTTSVLQPDRSGSWQPSGTVPSFAKPLG